MAKVQQKIIIELTRHEKVILDNLLRSLYEIEDDDKTIGKIFDDIYNSYEPKENQSSSEWKGKFADIIIKN